MSARGTLHWSLGIGHWSFVVSQSPCRCFGAELSDHIARRGLDGFLPALIAEAIFVFRPRVGKDNPARVVHNRPQSVVAKARRDVARRAALASITGNK